MNCVQEEDRLKQDKIERGLISPALPEICEKKMLRKKGCCAPKGLDA